MRASNIVCGVVAVLFMALLAGCAEPVARSAPELDLAADVTSDTMGLPEFVATGEPFDPVADPLMDAEPEPLDLFDADRAMVHVRALADGVGNRPAGSEAEREAAAYIADQLVSWGYTPRFEEFPLPNGLTSLNVVAERPGTSDARFVLGGHFDTKSPSPGANDNGTGVGVVLEIARLLSESDPVATIEFAFFGSEERIDADPDHHHYGSRARVAAMSAQDMQATAGMISVDMIGWGPDFHVRTMRKGPQSLSDDLLAYAREREIACTFKLDPGSTGWSDHEAYELAGIPAAWVEWRDDPTYHTVGDTAAHVRVDRVDVAGELVWGYVQGLDAERLAGL